MLILHLRTDTQWLTSWLANNFLCEEIAGSLETNSIFLLALFSTVFTYSIQKNHIRVVDVLIIHQLCVGFLFSIMSLWGYRTSESFLLECCRVMSNSRAQCTTRPKDRVAVAISAASARISASF